jgi:hypothetical protein
MTVDQQSEPGLGAPSGGDQIVAHTGPNLADSILGAIFGDPDLEAGQ